MNRVFSFIHSKFSYHFLPAVSPGCMAAKKRINKYTFLSADTLFLLQQFRPTGIPVLSYSTSCPPFTCGRPRLSHFKKALMNPSIPPSSTAFTFPLSKPVRWSFTIVYG